MKKQIPVGVSARHIHLSQADIQILFGEGYELTPMKDLSQPGQFAAAETVAVEGPRGKFEKVRILGPARDLTQLEISRTDAYAIGVAAPVRLSGDVEGTPGVLIKGPAGEKTLDQGVIVAARHIHMHPDDADRLGVQSGQKVRVRTTGERAVTFEEVMIRVSAQFVLDMHIDTDEANAAGIANGDLAEIVE